MPVPALGLPKSRSHFALFLAAVVVAFALGGAGRASAQSPPPVVKARMVLSTDAVHPGSGAQAAVIAQIAPGYHINAHHPTLNYLIPTELKFEPVKPFSVEDISYPEGKMKKFVFAPDGLSVYQGRLVIPATLKTAASARPGNYTLRGRLSYQACNDRACLPPSSAGFFLSIRVVSRVTPLKATRSDVFAKGGLK